ncbi:MAG: hypothetical protein R6V12_04860 [Candidatus Hydrogenedentota bacterium]
MDTISLAWFVKDARHVWLGGLGVLTMYFSTVDFATVTRIFASSPTI